MAVSFDRSKKPRRKGSKARALVITPLGLSIISQIERGTYAFSTHRGGRFGKRRGRK